MNTYQVIGRVVELPAGTVELSDEQAARRKHAIERIGKRGRKFAILKPLQFKHGETFGYDGDLPKHLADAVEIDNSGHVNRAQPGPVRPTDDAVARAAISDAIAQLDPQNQAHYIDGVPVPIEVSKITGWEVSPDEIQVIIAAGSATNGVN